MQHRPILLYLNSLTDEKNLRQQLTILNPIFNLVNVILTVLIIGKSHPVFELLNNELIDLPQLWYYLAFCIISCAIIVYFILLIILHFQKYTKLQYNCAVIALKCQQVIFFMTPFSLLICVKAILCQIAAIFAIAVCILQFIFYIVHIMIWQRQIQLQCGTFLFCFSNILAIIQILLVMSVRLLQKYYMIPIAGVIALINIMITTAVTDLSKLTVLVPSIAISSLQILIGIMIGVLQVYKFSLSGMYAHILNWSVLFVLMYFILYQISKKKRIVTMTIKHTESISRDLSKKIRARQLYLDFINRFQHVSKDQHNTMLYKMIEYCKIISSQIISNNLLNLGSKQQCFNYIIGLITMFQKKFKDHDVNLIAQKLCLQIISGNKDNEQFLNNEVFQQIQQEDEQTQSIHFLLKLNCNIEGVKQTMALKQYVYALTGRYVDHGIVKQDQFVVCQQLQMQSALNIVALSKNDTIDINFRIDEICKNVAQYLLTCQNISKLSHNNKEPCQLILEQTLQMATVKHKIVTSLKQLRKLYPYAFATIWATCYANQAVFNIFEMDNSQLLLEQLSMLQNAPKLSQNKIIGIPNGSQLIAVLKQEQEQYSVYPPQQLDPQLLIQTDPEKEGTIKVLHNVILLKDPIIFKNLPPIKLIKKTLTSQICTIVLQYTVMILVVGYTLMNCSKQRIFGSDFIRDFQLPIFIPFQSELQKMILIAQQSANNSQYCQSIMQQICKQTVDNQLLSSSFELQPFDIVKYNKTEPIITFFCNLCINNDSLSQNLVRIVNETIHNNFFVKITNEVNDKNTKQIAGFQQKILSIHGYIIMYIFLLLCIWFSTALVKRVFMELQIFNTQLIHKIQLKKFNLTKKQQNFIQILKSGQIFFKNQENDDKQLKRIDYHICERRKKIIFFLAQFFAITFMIIQIYLVVQRFYSAYTTNLTKPTRFLYFKQFIDSNILFNKELFLQQKYSSSVMYDRQIISNIIAIDMLHSQNKSHQFAYAYNRMRIIREGKVLEDQTYISNRINQNLFEQQKQQKMMFFAMKTNFDQLELILNNNTTISENIQAPKSQTTIEIIFLLLAIAGVIVIPLPIAYRKSKIFFQCFISFLIAVTIAMSLTLTKKDEMLTDNSLLILQRFNNYMNPQSNKYLNQLQSENLTNFDSYNNQLICIGYQNYIAQLTNSSLDFAKKQLNNIFNFSKCDENINRTVVFDYFYNQFNSSYTNFLNLITQTFNNVVQQTQTIAIIQGILGFIIILIIIQVPNRLMYHNQRISDKAQLKLQFSYVSLVLITIIIILLVILTVLLFSFKPSTAAENDLEYIELIQQSNKYGINIDLNSYSYDFQLDSSLQWFIAQNDNTYVDNLKQQIEKSHNILLKCNSIFVDIIAAISLIIIVTSIIAIRKQQSSLKYLVQHLIILGTFISDENDIEPICGYNFQTTDFIEKI